MGNKLLIATVCNQLSNVDLVLYVRMCVNLCIHSPVWGGRDWFTFFPCRNTCLSLMGWTNCATADM